MVQKCAASDDAVTRWAKKRMPFLFVEETKETFFRRIKRLYSPFDTKYRDIELAYELAEYEFRKVTRAGGGSYFEGHLVPVALILIDYLEVRDHELIISALLHDIIEDVPEQTGESLGHLFGRRVANIVMSVSEPKAEECGSKEVAERIFHSRFEFASRDFFVVKNPDWLQNLITLGARPRDKQIAKIAETERHYVPQARKHLILLPELREVVQLWKEQLA